MLLQKIRKRISREVGITGRGDLTYDKRKKKSTWGDPRRRGNTAGGTEKQTPWDQIPPSKK